VNGPEVVNVLTSETSAEVARGTVLESVLEVTSSAVAVATLVTWPAATSPAVTV
jgi:hypothetical protein